MFLIIVKTLNNEDFGVLSRKSDSDDCQVSRQIGNPAQFETYKHAAEEVRKWHRNPNCDHFSFEIVDANYFG